MIPKVIHYCWFGGNELPELAQKCIASWKKYCPDYEIKEWNENNFELSSCRYVREAYEHKWWAFITEMCKKYGLKQNNQDQTIEGFRLYPKDVFCPKSYVTGKIECTDRTVTIHHFSGSWRNKDSVISMKIKGATEEKGAVIRVLGKIAASPFTLSDRIRREGFKKSIKYYCNKMVWVDKRK